MTRRARCPRCGAIQDVPVQDCDVCDWSLYAGTDD